jgi:hypothetical protein
MGKVGLTLLMAAMLIIGGLLFAVGYGAKHPHLQIDAVAVHPVDCTFRAAAGETFELRIVGTDREGKSFLVAADFDNRSREYTFRLPELGFGWIGIMKNRKVTEFSFPLALFEGASSRAEFTISFLGNTPIVAGPDGKPLGQPQPQPRSQ